MDEQAQAAMFDAARTLLQDPEVTNNAWTGLAVVFQLPDGDENHRAAFGYRYTDSDWEAFLLENFSAYADKMLAFRMTSQVTNDKPWCACLMQVTRAGMKLVCDLEYDDPTRWDVTPANLETRLEELRPKGA
jgi:hypothetical protein